jgi:plastocyanin
MRRRFSIVTRLAPLALLTAAALSAPTLTTAGGGCHGDIGSVYTEGSATVVRMDVCDFAPTVSRVPVGAEVRFLNTDQVPHIVIGRRLTWASAELSPGAEFVQRFDAAGTYPYMCSFHPGMVGAIVVDDAAAATEPSMEPSLVAATTTGDADDGPAVAVLIGAGALVLGAGLGMGLVLGRRRTATTTD